MECPSCGFIHVSPQSHCARCKKPMPGASDEYSLTGLVNQIRAEKSQSPVPAKPEKPAPAKKKAPAKEAKAKASPAKTTPPAAELEEPIKMEPAPPMPDAPGEPIMLDPEEAAEDLLPVEAAPIASAPEGEDFSALAAELARPLEAENFSPVLKKLPVKGYDASLPSTPAKDPMEYDPASDMSVTRAAPPSAAPAPPVSASAAPLAAEPEVKPLLLRRAEPEPGEESTALLDELDRLIEESETPETGVLSAEASNTGDLTIGAVDEAAAVESVAQLPEPAVSAADEDLSVIAVRAPAPEPTASPVNPSDEIAAVSRSDWSEGRMLDTFFGEAPEKPGVSAAAASDESVIKIRENREPSLDGSGPHLPFGERSGATESLSMERPVEERSGTRRIAPAASDSAPLWRRALAGVIDVAVWTGIAAAIYFGATALTGAEPRGTAGEWFSLMALPVLVMTVFLALVYRVMFLALTGWTPGLLASGLRATDMDGGRPAAARAFIHTVILLASLPVAPVMAIGCHKGGCPHDRIGGVRVTRGVP